MTTPQVGDRYVIERRFSHSGSVQHSREAQVTRVTAKRAYLGQRMWFALDDPTREVKPRYLDYRETATPFTSDATATNAGSKEK